jgi:hypothetical protein
VKEAKSTNEGRTHDDGGDEKKELSDAFDTRWPCGSAIAKHDALTMSSGLGLLLRWEMEEEEVEEGVGAYQAKGGNDGCVS